MSDHDYRIVSLYIKGVNIDNLPLNDIGEYLADFAKLLGADVAPRFDSIKGTGSITLRARVAPEKEIDVKTRAFLLRTGDAPEDAIQARNRISRRLGIHRAKQATVFDSTQAKVIETQLRQPRLYQLPCRVWPGLVRCKERSYVSAAGKISCPLNSRMWTGTFICVRPRGK
jgi:hypothetical protein